MHPSRKACIIIAQALLMCVYAFTWAGEADLVWSTFLGGNQLDEGRAIAVDDDGNVYVAGNTQSANFPYTYGAYDTAYNQGQDIFVAKLDSAGSELQFSTYIGGSFEDDCKGLVIYDEGDDPGNMYIYLAGSTLSSDYPTTPGAWGTDFNFSEYEAVFVTKINPGGSELVYSTLLEGSNSDFGRCIAVDCLGCAYVAGGTNSNDFPTTEGAFDRSFYETDPLRTDAFVTKFNSTGSDLVFSTYFGGNGGDNCFGIVIDENGYSYMVGGTGSSSGILCTHGAFDSTYNGNSDVFVAMFSPMGTDLQYATYLGGGELDIGMDLAIDGSGYAYVTGYTYSHDFPTTPGAFRTTFYGRQWYDQDYYCDAFVSKLNIEWHPSDSKGDALNYSTYLASGDPDRPYSIAVDSLGNAYISGYTGLTSDYIYHTMRGDFPTTPGAFSTDTSDCEDVFLTVINPAGSDLAYSCVFWGRIT